MGFTREFYWFLGVSKTARNYKHDLPMAKRAGLTGDTQNYFTPIDDFYSSPTGSDTVYDYGRVPVNHLMMLASQRLGIVWRACNGIAGDVFRNRFRFVDIDDPEKEIKNDQIKEIKRWMRSSKLWDRMVDILDFEGRCGLGHLVHYYPGEKGVMKLPIEAPNKRPNEFDSFSCYYMTPTNFYTEDTRLDYDKSAWDYIGGIVKPSGIHHSRVYTLETRRVEGGLRGIALAELCWIPLMCYLNTMFYVLKSLGQLGTVLGSINTEREFPTTAEIAQYTAFWDSMVANHCIVLGKNASLNLQNTASAIGEGIGTYIEFLLEDISAAWVFPKNQLLGRAEGGGLEGAGALISKEDYLSSNISVKQLNLVNDIIDLLMNHCKFKGLEDTTLQWDIDLHKSQEQRYKEQLMKEQVEQAKMATEQQVLMTKLYKLQAKLQIEMNKVQLEMFKANPKQFMEQTQKDEENLEEKKSKEQKDFSENGLDYLEAKHRLLQQHFDRNQDILMNLKK